MQQRRSMCADAFCECRTVRYGTTTKAGRTASPKVARLPAQPGRSRAVRSRTWRCRPGTRAGIAIAASPTSSPVCVDWPPCRRAQGSFFPWSIWCQHLDCGGRAARARPVITVALISQGGKPAYREAAWARVGARIIRFSGGLSPCSRLPSAAPAG